MIAIKNAKIVLETGIIWDGVLLIEGDRIKAVGKAGEISIPADAEVLDAEGKYVGPGFVDIHVHGGNGYMFDYQPLEAAEHFLSHGETSILATLYYNLGKTEFVECIDRVKAVIGKGAGKAIAGFYMEGPYMNPIYGAAPDKNKWKGEIRKEDYQPLLDHAGDLAKIWAVAPEREGLEPFLRDAKAANPTTVFAVGHSEATPEQVAALRPYGLTIQTHCTNATGRPETMVGTRSCGPDEYCMTDPTMYAEIISDSQGIHVHSDMMRMIVAVKGVDHSVLVTDSYVTGDDNPPPYDTIKDLGFDHNGLLCGSKLTMEVACRNLMAHTNCGIAQAFLMASRNPARVIGMDHEVGSIRVGKKANLVFVDDVFHVYKVMLEGQLI